MTIFCGQNAVGKSSLIQALLIMRETAIQTADPKVARLNGPFRLELGQVMDVMNHKVSENLIEFNLTDERSEQFEWVFPTALSRTEDQFLVAESPCRSYPPCFSSNESFKFTYLCPERLGPRDTQPTQSTPEANLQIGVQGEFTAEILMKREYKNIREGLLRSTAGEQRETNKRLGKQVELWMRDLAPGIEIRPLSFSDTNTTAIRIKKGGAASEWMRPVNIGFGVSYSLPIIVAGLLAPPGSLFIVDSPESHLHPGAQSNIARFLCTLAANGVQVVIETHSDHILNGVRLAAVDSSPLTKEDVIIHNFSIDPDGVFKDDFIEITPTGSLSKWPKGFLDQTERDLAAILKARKR